MTVVLMPFPPAKQDGASPVDGSMHVEDTVEGERPKHSPVSVVCERARTMVSVSCERRSEHTEESCAVAAPVTQRVVTLPQHEHA
jgi:hypothetical protein